MKGQQIMADNQIWFVSCSVKLAGWTQWTEITRYFTTELEAIRFEYRMRCAEAGKAKGSVKDITQAEPLQLVSGKDAAIALLDNLD